MGVFAAMPHRASQLSPHGAKSATFATALGHPTEDAAMVLLRRQFLHLAAGAASLLAASRAARAQAYPTRPVRIVVPYPAGIAPDLVTRLVAQSLSLQLGQQFIVDDRPGGAANVGTEIVVHALPDGYTLLTATMTNAINVSLYDNLGFDFVHDIAPVSGLVFLPLVVVVNPSVPVKTLPEFIAYAKANPGNINYASVGSGAATNVAGELFKQMAGVNLVNVPYRSNYLPDLLSGQVQASFTPILQSIGYIRADKLRALAVTSAKPSDVLPGIPTVAQFVPGYEAIVWDGMGAPANTPSDIIETLNKAINEVLLDPATKARLADLGSEPMVMTPAQFGKFVVDESEKWGKVVKAAGIKPE
jgi:tripartite-type tricarboxylate transporter receptor subunit TctC